MSADSVFTAGILLITVPTIAFGGARLLRAIWAREPGYLDNPVRQAFWRAGHAHAGVLVLLALVAMLYIDRARLPEGLDWIVRLLLVLPPILMPLGFFLSVASPRSERPNALAYLIPLGGVSLAVGTLGLGIGLVAG